MRRLILLRHAKTEKAAESGRDFDRRLDEKGRIAATRMGRFLRAAHLVPDLVLVSPAVRAQETWALLAAELNSPPPAKTLPDLYGADATQLLTFTHDAEDFADQKPVTSVMIVAHNPGIHEYAMTLTVSGAAPDREAVSAGMPTAGLAVIDFRTEDWGTVAFRSGHLARFVSPRTLDEAEAS
jgi:phosphohistidine phosphatase